MGRPKITVPGTAATIRAQRERQRAYDIDPEAFERREQRRQERREMEQRRLQEEYENQMKQAYYCPPCGALIAEDCICDFEDDIDDELPF